MVMSHTIVVFHCLANFFFVAEKRGFFLRPTDDVRSAHCQLRGRYAVQNVATVTVGPEACTCQLV